ncbi:amidohydrolase family protein [Radiobacillus sp. PE A8.2]|uniref:amidohydrolase family protein n=1 Tax=Radiobacillus sp. PE A8.2 TaxID=3380349 RepID=UPI00388F61CD
MTLDKGIKYVVENCNIPLPEAIYMVTQSPLTAIRANRKIGQIANGFKADIVILNQNLDVLETFINGKSVFKKDKG